MIETPLPAYVKVYWDDVADVLKSVHGAKVAEVRTAIAAYRDHMRPAGQTIYNRSPESVAKSIVGHGLIPSLPAIDAKLQLTFTLADPMKVLESSEAATLASSKLIAALERLERASGGEGFTVGTPEAIPGMVLLALTPVQAMSAVERLTKVAKELDRASRQLVKADKELKGETARHEKAGEQVTAAVMCQAASAVQAVAESASLPTREEIEQLPVWARVAFAARCARQALPLFQKFWPTVAIHHVNRVEQAVTFAEDAAASSSAPLSFNSYTGAGAAADAVRIDSQQSVIGVLNNAYADAPITTRPDTARAAAAAAHTAVYARCAEAAARAAENAAHAAADAGLNGNADGNASAVRAAYAATYAASAGVSPTHIRADFKLVWEESRRALWTDSSPVPKTVFGPLMIE
jgi:hypothetical protein